MTPRDHYAGLAMAVLMLQHPNTTRGWIKQRAFEMADVMLQPGMPAECDQWRPFADAPRIYAEDEPFIAAPPQETPP